MNYFFTAISFVLFTFRFVMPVGAQSSVIIDNCGVSYIDPQDVIAKDAPSYDTVIYQTRFAETARQRAYFVDVNAFGGRQVDRAIVRAIMPDDTRPFMGEIAFGNCVGCVSGFALVYNDSVWVQDVHDRPTMDLWLQSFNQPPFALTSNLQVLNGVGRLSGLLPLCAEGVLVTFIVYSDPASTTTEFAAHVICPEVVRDCQMEINAEVDCQKDSIFLEAAIPRECFSSRAQFRWWNKAGFTSGVSRVALPLSGNEGMFYFAVQDEYCVLVDSILVENPVFAEAGADQTICQGEDVMLAGAGGIRYFWENGSGFRSEGEHWLLPAVKADDAGRYIVHAFDQSGCEDTDTLLLTVRVPVAPEVAVSNACLGDTVRFSVTNDTNFEQLRWYDARGDSLFPPLIADLQMTDFGEYTVEAIDRLGCRSERRFAVTGGRPPEFSYVIEDDCDSTRIYLQPDFYQYHWDNGGKGPFLSTSTGGLFGLSITDSLGCQTVVSIEAPAPDGPDVTVTLEHPGCPNEYGAIELELADPDQPAVFSIDGGQTYSLSNRFEDLLPGRYTVTVLDDLGCVQRLPVELVAPDTLGVDIGLERLDVRPGTAVTLEAETVGNVVRYQWLPREIDTGVPYTEFTANQNLDIRLIVEDDRGCLMSDALALTIVLGDIYVPNAFSPDADGNNDTFVLYSDKGSGEIIEYLRIFDRYGTLLFEAKDIFPNDEASGWNGTYRGQKLNAGVYVYDALVRFGNGVRKEYKGDVVLVR